MPLLIFMHWLLRLLMPQPPAFVEQTIDKNISIGYGLALGDVDGDGKPDILLADAKQFVWYRNGDWKKFVMVDNLTERDNVCIAAEDIDGDGKVEVAVGAQWNPGETSNDAQSGSVHYLIRPSDPTQLWKPVELHHEVTIHRMKWMKGADKKYYLIVLPLHGKDNKNGEGKGVNILAYEFPKNVNDQWRTYSIDSSHHLTHGLNIVQHGIDNKPGVFIASKEGVQFIGNDLKSNSVKAMPVTGISNGAGEVRIGNLGKGKQFIATVEPMHGDKIALYLLNDQSKRILLDDNVKEGHALGVEDFLGTGSDQVIAGWRNPNKDGKTGIKFFAPQNAEGTEWQSTWIDENGIACEDLQVRDMNGDGKPDIVASGRATKNVKIYWNKSVN